MENEGDLGAAVASCGALLHRVSEAVALIGGAILIGAMLFVSVNVVSAALFVTPILGDTEIVEMMGAVAITAFLPYCHFERANVIIELIERFVSPRTTVVLDFAAGLIFTVVAVIILWRLVAGGLDANADDDATMFLRIPHVIGYIGVIIPCTLWAVVAFYVNITQWRQVVGTA